ncbi:alpha/beta fold hydrolase [Numidum massiliense]|uniref:alpha/beta fold hydrolase n=1 Tax=Numidum massiliense TaxID=1522315 RepID=UPI0006D5B02F|nr:alpha/beta fold hydrolase [Numidum massiliense]
MGTTIKEQEAVEIAKESYEDNKTKFEVKMNDGSSTIWKVIEEVKDLETGLHMYVIQNPKTKEVVISFEGTELKKGIRQAANDLREDVNGIFLGQPAYTEKEINIGKDGDLEHNKRLKELLKDPRVKLKDGQLIYENKNQFTAFEDVVNKYIKKYGADNVTFVGHSLGGALAQIYAVKHHANAIVFASADAYQLLTDEEKKKVRDGVYRDKIIAYTYPDDAIGNSFSKAIGSVYYMADPREFKWKWISSHFISNYDDDGLYDDEGYFLPKVLFDGVTGGAISKSPLALKNSGQSNFAILLQTEIMRKYAEAMNESLQQVTNSWEGFKRFPSVHDDAVKSIRSKYNSLVGTGDFDKLTSADVDKALKWLSLSSDGKDQLFYYQFLYDDVLKQLNDLVNDTAEISYHMTEIADKFEEIDRILAEWFNLKQ